MGMYDFGRGKRKGKGKRGFEYVNWHLMRFWLVMVSDSSYIFTTLDAFNVFSFAVTLCVWLSSCIIFFHANIRFIERFNLVRRLVFFCYHDIGNTKFQPPLMMTNLLREPVRHIRWVLPFQSNFLHTYESEIELLTTY
jgi:hypothetical protein